MTCRSVLYAFSAAPACSKPSTHDCTSSGVIASSSASAHRGKTCSSRALR
nr:MAG TPA: hypothetical protein [Caudoviricetes sp.]